LFYFPPTIFVDAIILCGPNILLTRVASPSLYVDANKNSFTFSLCLFKSLRPAELYLERATGSKNIKFETNSSTGSSDRKFDRKLKIRTVIKYYSTVPNLTFLAYNKTNKLVNPWLRPSITLFYHLFLET